MSYVSFKKNRRHYLLWAYILLLHLTISVLLFETDFIPRVTARLGTPVERKELNSFHQNMVAFHMRQDKNIPAESILFFGDSITQGLAVTAIDRYAVNFGIGHDSSLTLLERLPYYSSIKQAKLIVLAIGINDVLRDRSKEEIIDNYKKIIDFIPPHIPILISPIFPVDELALGRPGYNQRIGTLNDKIKEFCKSSKGISCLETWQDIQDSDGNLADIYHTGDGLHLNYQGNNAWIKQLKHHIAKVYKHNN